MSFSKMLRLLFQAALSPLLLYYVGGILVGGGMWPVWHWILMVSALVSATLVVALAIWWPQRVDALPVWAICGCRSTMFRAQAL